MEQSQTIALEETKVTPLTVLLIDLDNCPNTLYELPDRLDEFARIIACHGLQEPKIPLSLVSLIAGAIADGRLEIYGSKRGGKNAADFAMTFFAGRLLAEMPDNTTFEIWSSDKDLDHAVDLLSAGQRRAVRIDQNTKNLQQKQREFEAGVACRYHDWVMLQPNPPARSKTLKTSIKKYLDKEKIEGVSAETIYQTMFTRELFSQAGSGKLTFLPLRYDGYGEPVDLCEDIPF